MAFFVGQNGAVFFLEEDIFVSSFCDPFLAYSQKYDEYWNMRDYSIRLIDTATTNVFFESNNLLPVNSSYWFKTWAYDSKQEYLNAFRKFNRVVLNMQLDKIAISIS